ncbi:unnamed protein product [Blumeria hordei]|uniref:Carboxylic ester hydrolase n=1 Tax=Blumeria hordei TaxID=2867405 RepID=A0A383UKS1_BLUHO|nr:unnamed protein product [Blumeria hordei]
MRFSTLPFVLSIISVHAKELLSRQSEWQVGQPVSTSSGPVTGHDAGNDTKVSEYLGIPFAEPPIGKFRFAAPRKFVGTAQLNGTKFGPSCQVKPGSSSPTPDELAKANLTAETAIVDNLFTDHNQVNEDCLYLNVWTKPQVGEKKKAVLVWIYGGAFNTGSSSINAYNGRNLAALEDVVVVSLNYRLNIFGFPAHPNGTYNVAFLDQRLAIEWVRDNIEKFGGDPSRITIFGQSAGASSIDFYTYAWESDPIASGFIMESGTVFSWGLPNSASTTTAAWFSTSQKLGCGNSTSPPNSVLSCMQSKSPEEIYAAIPSGPASEILGSFGPTIDNNIVFSNYSDRAPANVPILLGNNDYEAGLFRTEFSMHGIELSETFWTDFNLQEFTCPCSDRANSSIAAKVPTWRYRYMGVYPNLEISPKAGAWHGAEIPLIFNTTPENMSSTPEEIATGKYIRGAWSAFAKDPSDGLTKYGWPKYDPTQDTLVRIGRKDIPGPSLINPYRYDADCPFFNVSSTDPSKFPDVPDYGANVTPTGTGGEAPSATGLTIAPFSSANSASTLNSRAVGVFGSTSLMMIFGRHF